MLTIEPRRPMRQHATKMGKRTAFHAEAEHYRLLNARISSEAERTVYINAALKLDKRIRKARSQRIKEFMDAFKANSSEIAKRITEHAHPPVGLWRQLLERDDHRVYAARRTGIVDVAEIEQGLWWYQQTWGDQFDLFELSQAVVADEAQQEIYEQNARRNRSESR